MSLFRSSTGLFKEIPCPAGAKCNLGNCMYSHTSNKIQQSNPERKMPKRVSTPDPELASKRPKKDNEKNLQANEDKSQDKNKLLVPAVVSSPPVQHRQRVQFLHVIRDKLADNGYKNANSRAIDLESSIAQRCTQFTYPMGIRSIVREITTKQLDTEHERQEQDEKSERMTYCMELVNLIVPIRELEKRRYVVTKPDSSPLEPTQIMPCARCSSKFPIYNPSTRTTSCRFHLLKRQWDPAIKRLSPMFPCCGESVDESSGCEQRDFHVFKVDEASGMQALIPFKETPSPQGDQSIGEFAVGLDCEMAWTTKGFELIRVTVVSYLSRSTIFDRLVWPQGKILDLNTRFSGVSDMNEGTQFQGQTLPPLSLEDLYSELFEIVSAKTIMIGHGLENDLNALRLIHHRVVDTAILYPRIRHRTHSLKELAWDFLSRNIQSGEHDSMEDSLAAIDVVRQDIKNRCFKQKVQSFK